MTITALRPTLTPALDAVGLGNASGREQASSAASHTLRCVRTPHVVSLYSQPSAWSPDAHRWTLRQPGSLQPAA